MMFLWSISPASSRRRATRSRRNGRSLVSRGLFRTGPACTRSAATETPGRVWVSASRPTNRPLYVGKAENSLVARDVKTHFGDGRTGQSTVRRSFAALLHDELGLRGVPRNTAKPGYYANYGLSAPHDAVLTRRELSGCGRPSTEWSEGPVSTRSPRGRKRRSRPESSINGSIPTAPWSTCKSI